MEKVIVVAIGGNAIVKNGESGTVGEQLSNIEASCANIVRLVEAGYRVVLTHGNGPQVGNLMIKNELSRAYVPAYPVDVCGAQTQGELGYLISQTLSNMLQERGIHRDIAVILTRVIVDEHDERFRTPSKPVGPFFTEGEAGQMMAEYGFPMREDSGRGWRRVVPSPMPVNIVERDAIRCLMGRGALVIAGGGGGIPVVQRGDKMVGIEAVIDKDYCSAIIAREVGADCLFILTGVNKVALNFGTPAMKQISRMTVEQARAYLAQGQFPAGSMGPKVDAACRFAASGGVAIITSIHKMLDALEGRDGTWIVDGGGMTPGYLA